MKTKDLILISLLFLAVVLMTGEIVNFHLTGNHLFGSAQRPVKTNTGLATCTSALIKVRPATADPQLKVVPEYEQACKSGFINNMMIFTNMPISVENAQEQANDMAIRLKSFDQQRISPIVIIEPDSDWGLVDFQEYAGGYYDPWVNAYFEQLKQNGVTDSMLGLWIPFPEPQQPTWNNSTPDGFADSVNRYLTSLRSIFPKGRTGILLDSQAGSGDNSLQLVAYTRLIDVSLVDVAGLQGFPWFPTEDGDKRAAITSASEFAPAYLLNQVAKSLKTKEVLLNIGTFRNRKTMNGGDLTVTTAQRQSELDSIVHEVSLLKEMNYSVTVNIFAENKFNVKEGVDWSYWQNGEYAKSEQAFLFTNFIKDLQPYGVNVSLYDSRD